MQKLFNHTFAGMLFKNNYIHKCISAMLLVVLLLIHSIKLLHTHPGNNSFVNHNCSGNCFEKSDNSDLTRSSSDCSICNYQLTKDADAFVCPAFFNPVTEQINFNTSLIFSYKPSHPSSLENRGPPAFTL